MPSPRGLSAIALGAAGAGALLVWSGLRGASVLESAQAVLQGKQPSGEAVHGVETPQERPPAGVADIGEAAGFAPSSFNQIVQIAASMKGQCYGFGAGHGNVCNSKCSDCSSYASCVASKATGRHIDLTTGGWARYGKGVPYAQRQAGDFIVWNGGTGGGHMGIIIDAAHMWNNPCRICGGVQISRYPYGNRTAAAAVVRRIT